MRRDTFLRSSWTESEYDISVNLKRIPAKITKSVFNLSILFFESNKCTSIAGLQMSTRGQISISLITQIIASCELIVYCFYNHEEDNRVVL